jgi:hypothetical protein
MASNAGFFSTDNTQQAVKRCMQQDATAAAKRSASMLLHIQQKPSAAATQLRLKGLLLCWCPNRH